MSKIIDQGLSGGTITYGPVQFGGADASNITVALDPTADPNVKLKSLPPMYAIRSQFRYDDSNRTVIGVDYVLTVRAIFFGDTNVELATNMEALRKWLSAPRQVLTISGLGIGFGQITSGAVGAGDDGQHYDIEYGPKPLSLSMQPVGGNRAWELTWEVAFFLSECGALGDSETTKGLFLSFNTTATWANDFEGLPTRTIQGYVQIPQITTNTQDPSRELDAIRDEIKVRVPKNFRRVQNVWRLNEARTRLDFSVVDEALPGDNLPPGITLGRGSFNVTADIGQNNTGMNMARAVLQMTLKVAPGIHPSTAAYYFMAIYLTKQTKLCLLSSTGKAQLLVIPIHFSISSMYFDEQRVVQCSGAWQVTNAITLANGVAKNEAGEIVSTALAGVSGILTAADLFTPVSSMLTGVVGSPQYYDAWAATMAKEWRNRGFLNMQDTDGAPMYDLCNEVTGIIIGGSIQDFAVSGSTALPTMGCPAVPKNGGWISYQLRVDFWREDYRSVHRRAISYMPGSSTQWQGAVDPSSTSIIPIETGAPMPYDNEGNKKHVTEYNGRPRLFVAVSVASLRFQHLPYLNRIKSVGGFPVERVEDSGTLTPQYAFNAFGCPVYRQQGYVIYEVQGNPSTVDDMGRPLRPDVEFDGAKEWDM